MSEELLPVTSPRYQYQGLAKCVEIMEKAIDRDEGDATHYIIIFGVDERSFLECFEMSQERVLTRYWVNYCFTSHTVLLKMESPPHATAAGCFSQLLTSWCLQQSSHLRSTSTQGVRGNTRYKKPDCSWTPDDLPCARSTKWPTIVVEVAYSETERRLEDDMRFWLTESGGDVRVALSIKVHRRGRMIIEQWSLRPGPTTPFPSQKIEIVPHAAPKCQRINGALTLRFEDVYLREKGKDEFDFISPMLIWRQWDLMYGKLYIQNPCRRRDAVDRGGGGGYGGQGR